MYINGQGNQGQQPQPQAQPQPQPQPQPQVQPQQNQNANYAVQMQQLNNYRNQLIGVHNGLKQQQDLLNTLKAAGIESVKDFNDFKDYMTQDQQADSGQQDNTQTEHNDTEGQDLENDWKEEMMREVKSLKQTVSNQNYQLRKTSLKEQVSKAIQGKPEYQFLNRSMNDQTIDILLQNMDQYKQDYNQDISLDEALRLTEQNLRDTFTRLGGNIPPAFKAHTQNKTPQPQAQTQPVPKELQAPPQLQETAPITQLPPSGSLTQAPHQPKPFSGKMGFSRDAEINSFLKEQGIE